MFVHVHSGESQNGLGQDATTNSFHGLTDGGWGLGARNKGLLDGGSWPR